MRQRWVGGVYQSGGSCGFGFRGVLWRRSVELPGEVWWAPASVEGDGPQCQSVVRWFCVHLGHPCASSPEGKPSLTSEEGARVLFSNFVLVYFLCWEGIGIIVGRFMIILFLMTMAGGDSGLRDRVLQETAWIGVFSSANLRWFP